MEIFVAEQKKKQNTYTHTHAHNCEKQWVKKQQTDKDRMIEREEEEERI